MNGEASGGRGPYTITPDELEALLGAPDLRMIDGSWYLPAQNRDAKAEFATSRIPGAVYFDIDARSDQSSPLPHMLPTPEAFAKASGALGVSETDDIVVYDGPGVFSAPRVWWMFRVMGAKRVRVLDGGFDRWKSDGRPVETGAPVQPEPAKFEAYFNTGAVADIDDIRATIKSGAVQILDARPYERFTGQTPEPRPGLRGGHMPGAKSLPVAELTENGRLKDIYALKQIFAELAVGEGRPTITSCGSGVTAAVISLALETAGHFSHRLYDGSWSEWGQADSAPVARWED